MKTLKLRKLLYSAIITSSAISTASIYAHNTRDYSQFYVGADAVYSKLGFKQDYGQEMFSKKFAPGVNLFAGHMFNKNFGVELGWEMYKKMKRTAKVDGGKKAAGVLIDPIVFEWKSYDTTIKQQYPYLGAIAKTNLINENIFASIMLGISAAKIKTQFDSHLDDQGPTNAEIRNFCKTKPIAIARIAIDYKFNDNFGLKAFGKWKNTSKFKMTSRENHNGDSELKLKDSFGVGIGFTYYI